MAAVASAELVAEIEAAAESGPRERRARILQQIADLFVAGANRHQPRPVGPFDVTAPSPAKKEKTHNTPARMEVHQ